MIIINKNAVSLNIKGIKCDNKNCDYKNEDVKFEDFEQWLNKPCPKCGENLLTQKDFSNTKLLIKLTKMANKILPSVNYDEPMVKALIDIDGADSMKITIGKEDI